MIKFISSVFLTIVIISCGGDSDGTMSSLSIKYDAKKIDMYDIRYSIDFQKSLNGQRIIFKTVIEDIFLMNDTMVLKCNNLNPNLDVYSLILSKEPLDYKSFEIDEQIYIVADIIEVTPSDGTTWEAIDDRYYLHSSVTIRGYLVDYFQ